MNRKTWKCQYCDTVFSTKSKLQKHKKEKHIEKLGINWAKGLTKETDERIFKRAKSLSNTMKELSKQGKLTGKASTPEKEIERRKRISESMKKAHKEGSAGEWTKSTNKESYPEKWLSKMLFNELNLRENIHYIREYPFHRFRLDFYFPYCKKVIEMDGSQHYKTGSLTDNDKEKDKLLKEENYSELRIPWQDCFNNTQKWISIIKEFLTKNISDYKEEYAKAIYLYNKNKSAKIPKEYKLKTPYYKEINGKLHFLKIVNPIELEKRKNLILESKIDLTKFGYVTKLLKTTGLSKKIIYNTIRYYNLPCFKCKGQKI